MLSNQIYDITTLTALITIFSILVKGIVNNKKTLVTKILMGILAIGLLILFFFMVVDINQNGS